MTIERNVNRIGFPSSRFVKLQNFVIKAGGRVGQGLTHIFVFQFRIFRVQLFAIRVCGQGFEYAADSQSQAANARLPVHDRWITRDSIEAGHIRTPWITEQFPGESLFYLDHWTSARGAWGT
jgi:hypothetical protein